MTKLEGKTAVVTGGSKGLGRGIAEAMAGAGATVWAVARDEAALDALRREVPGVHTLAADVTQADTAGRVVREIQPDIAVLSAGATPRMAPVHDQSWEEFSRVWNTDVKATFLFAREALTAPLRPGSTVVIVSSGAAIHGSPLSGGYAGAKRMQWLLAGYLQKESAELGRGIRFAALLPKQIVGDTALGRAAATGYASRQGISVEAFLERFGAPLDPGGVGRAVVSIVTDPDRASATAFGLTGRGGLEALA